MRLIRGNEKWLAAVAVGILLVGAAVGMAGKESAGPLPSTHAARELSTAFREAAKEALPSIVAIETRGKRGGGRGPPPHTCPHRAPGKADPGQRRIPFSL